MTLDNVPRASTNKITSECLSYLTSRISYIHLGFHQQYRSEVIICGKLLNAVRDTTACRLPFQKPASTFRGVIADLQTSVAAVVDLDLNNGPTANYVDRRRHDHRENKFNMRSRLGGGSRSESNSIVCGKPNCWSTNHPFCEGMNAVNNNKHIKSFVAQFNENTYDHSNPEEQDVIDLLVAGILEISNAPDDSCVKVGASTYNDDDNLQTFFAISLICPHHTSSLTKS